MSFFQNKTVWITGASSGIGEALAYTFAKAGAKLVLSARRADELVRVKQASELPDENILLLPMDVANYSHVDEAVAKVSDHFGQIDILVNNAGVSHWAKVKDLGLDVIRQVMEVNFMGGVALTKAVLPGMLARKAGEIVVVSSILGKIVTPKQAAYVASKHALQGFYDTLRAEVADDGVGVLLVCPGFVQTNVAKNSLDKNGKPINKDNPLIKGGLDPMHVAELVLKAIEQQKNEVILAGANEKLGILLKRFFPGFYTHVVAKRKAS